MRLFDVVFKVLIIRDMRTAAVWKIAHQHPCWADETLPAVADGLKISACWVTVGRGV